MIRVLVADDHAAVRRGVRYLLEQQPDIELVGEVADGGEAIRLAVELKPDVVIIEPLMAPGGLEVVREIGRHDSPPSVIVMSANPDGVRILGAAGASALSYLAKDAGPEELLRVVRAAAEGSSAMIARSAEVQEQAGPRREHLTPRELDVLARLARGKTNREIAADLGLGVETVKTHVSHMLAKLGVTDRTQASVRALRSGLVSPDSPGGP